LFVRKVSPLASILLLISVREVIKSLNAYSDILLGLTGISFDVKKFLITLSTEVPAFNATCELVPDILSLMILTIVSLLFTSVLPSNAVKSTS
jgi:hypothetical protein